MPELPNDFYKLHRSLNVLHSEGNDMNQLPPEFHLLTKLQGLFLQGNKLYDSALDVIQKLPNLENLGLRSSGISEFSEGFTGDSRLLKAYKTAQSDAVKLRQERKNRVVIQKKLEAEAASAAAVNLKKKPGLRFFRLSQPTT
jgi:Leucine-rich repeat (LRR) protein